MLDIVVTLRLLKSRVEVRKSVFHLKAVNFLNNLKGVQMPLTLTGILKSYASLYVSKYTRFVCLYLYIHIPFWLILAYNLIYFEGGTLPRCLWDFVLIFVSFFRIHRNCLTSAFVLSV